MADLIQTVRRSMVASQLAAAAAALRDDRPSILLGADVRGLTDVEINQLERQANWAEAWDNVHVARDFRPEAVRNNRFYGRVVLGRCSGARKDLGGGVSLPTGVYDSTLADTEIGTDVVVHRVGLLQSAVVYDQAAVVSCSSVTCPDETTFGCGELLTLGIESSGRDVRAYAEMTIGVAQQLATSRGDRALLEEYDRLVEEYLIRVRSRRSVLEAGSIVMDTMQIHGAYVGASARVSGASLVESSCLLSSPDEPVLVGSGAVLDHAVVQWGARVDSMGLVDTSILCEHSHVERHGKVTRSVVGPNSGVGEGEVTASLVGPFVGFHHQALLIAALWPEGRGNVGYGANIGSNHTGRAPDQEIWCGEGTFFGLGVSIKYPTNLTRSPYSIIASGVACLPQEIQFPFSLINSPSARITGLSPSINEIFPGWVLKENIYMVKRNEAKYGERNKAQREDFDFAVFRPEIVGWMADARERLAAAGGKASYTDREIPGLGKNYLTEACRQVGLATYDFYLGWYARRGFAGQLKDRNFKASAPQATDLLRKPSSDPVWEQQRQLLAGEAAQQTVPSLLEDLMARERQIAEDLEQSKARDDQRGRKIIPDYGQVHEPATQDTFVRETWEQFRRYKAEIESLLA